MTVVNGKFLARTPMMSKLFKRVDAKGQAYMLAAHDYYERKARAAIEERAQPEGMAAGLHDLVDMMVEDLKGKQPENTKRIACGKGCSHCCYQQVDITLPEARLLMRFLVEEDIKPDSELLARQIAAGKDWDALPHAERACVLLDASTGQCRVYEHRPVACRKYFALDNSAQCDTSKGPGKVLNFVVPDAEIVQSACFEVMETGSLPLMLMAAAAAIHEEEKQ